MSNIDKLNLMRPNALSSTNRVPGVGSTGAAQNRQILADTGKMLPKSNTSAQVSVVQEKDINKAAKEVSGYVQNITRQLNFSVDEELDTTVITVIDDETGDVIRQIPTEDFLELAKNIERAKDDDTSKGILFQGDA